MKIISKQDVSNWSYSHKCNNCETQLEVDSQDLRHHHYAGDYREPSYDSYTAQCPVCSQTFTVPSAKIPRLIQIEAQNRAPKSSSVW